jgi:hypothetical protein
MKDKVNKDESRDDPMPVRMFALLLLPKFLDGDSPQPEFTR